ncbi:NADP-dependent oxidoreductase domain-containing protein [Pisolithus marmoratus]|nr:NADP-dependent oxidoreductase domain-containing protein [Pisolithus marmoratus]
MGTALCESGLLQLDMFITTKYSGLNGLDIPTSIQNSLSNLGMEYIDLYLIHQPHLAILDIPTVWVQMEKVHEAGLAKSTGMSNFNAKDLTVLLASAKVKPAVNQILLHPYVYCCQHPILQYAAVNGIVIEAYSTLITSLKKSKLEGYLAVVCCPWVDLGGWVFHLGTVPSEEDVTAIDIARELGEEGTCAMQKWVGADKVWNMVCTSNDTIVSGPTGRIVKLWDSMSGQVSLPHPLHNLTIMPQSVSPDAQFVLYDTLEGMTCLWDIQSDRM